MPTRRRDSPFIIDFAKMPTAKMPANMPQQMQRYEAQAKARDANAAWWPNGKSGKQPKSGSSLRGEHRVTSGFTPEIKFALVNDYMASLNVNYERFGCANPAQLEQRADRNRLCSLGDGRDGAGRAGRRHGDVDVGQQPRIQRRHGLAFARRGAAPDRP
jgi:hypothetical protein